MEMWNAMDALQRTLLLIAAPATMLLVLEMVLLLVGMLHGPGDIGGDADAPDVDAPETDMDIDADVDADMDIDGDADMPDLPDAEELSPRAVAGEGARSPGSLRWFTSIGVLALLAITGWAGLALIDAMLPPVLAVAIAVGLGVLAMYLCAVAMRKLSSLGASGNIALRNAVGQFAEAYMPIAPGRERGGKVTLTLQGRFVELDAVTDDDRGIATGEKVVVTGIVDGAYVLVRRARK